jgi:penicillin-binding protein 1C
VRRVFKLGALVGGASLLAALAGAVWLFLVPTDIESFETVKAKWTPSEAWLLDRNGVPLEQQRMDYTHRRFEWTTLEAVSPALITAIVDGEDRRFWEHSGVDWAAMLGAMRDRGVSQRRRGASTLSMQLGKMLRPGVRAGSAPGALGRKFAQMRVARTLESRWTKRQILEAYLNVVGFRREIQGVDAASRLLARKAPSGLSLAESSVLAALLPSPAAASKVVAARACARATFSHAPVSCVEIGSRAAEMLDQFDRSGRGSLAGPSLAPHVARAMLRHPGEHIATTLDASVQTLANDVLRQHLAGLTARNVRDGAVLIVDNESGDVLAYVGSAGPTSRAREVDGVKARRQAGSTLKPFLYELAIERGYLNASSLLDDSPVSLDTASGAYLPQNYDKEFKGLVSVRTSLASSLNVPAVRTLVLTGVEPFRDRLHSLGYAGITEPGDFYGYALALGAPEVSLWEQVQAYRTLARGGEWGEISIRKRAAQPGKQVFSADAAFIVTDMMSDRAARVVTFGLDNYLNTPFWSAVKTGTSKDMRDNWCIGFSRRYTVGVWVGNFEGDSMHDVSGVTGAAPVWRQLMVALHANTPSAAPPMPAGVTVARARFTPAVEAPRRELYLRASASVRGAEAQAEGADAVTHVTAVSATGEIARISSPANGMVIALDPDIPTAFQRVPLTAKGAGDGMVFKLNGTVVGHANGHVLWSPKPGSHLLALEDSAGHTLDRAHFIVR